MQAMIGGVTPFSHAWSTAAPLPGRRWRRGTLRVAVSAGGQWGTLTAGVSYDAGSVSSVVGDNVASAGSSEVTVSGAHYGTSAYSVGVRVGGSACESEEWASESSVVCRVGAGVGGTRRVAVSAGGQWGTLTAGVSYDAGSVSSVVGDNVASAGSSEVTVSGAHYGTSAYSVGVRVGGSACESEEWASESSVVCRVGAGVGGTRRVAVSAGGQWGTLTAGVSYDAGSVSSVVGDNVASTGSSEVTVSGAHYGTSAYSVGVRVGGSACESEEWASESSVVCRVGAGVGGTRRVAVSAGGQWGTLTAGVSYDAGSVSSVSATMWLARADCACDCERAHYGTSAYSVGVRRAGVGGSACESGGQGRATRVVVCAWLEACVQRAACVWAAARVASESSVVWTALAR